MAALAAVCGILIALFGLVATGRTPSEAQLSIEVTAFVGGLVLCFLAVVLARLKRLDRRIEGAASQFAAASPLVRSGAAQPLVSPRGRRWPDSGRVG